MTNPLDVWDSVWKLHDDMDEMHIVPPNDLVAHELTTDCVCGPYIEHLGGKDYLVVHSALDGRS